MLVQAGAGSLYSFSGIWSGQCVVYDLFAGRPRWIQPRENAEDMLCGTCFHGVSDLCASEWLRGYILRWPGVPRFLVTPALSYLQSVKWVDSSADFTEGS